MVNLISAAIDNMPACREHWNETANTAGVIHKDKAKAMGFLNTWQSGDLQIYITAVMGDVAVIYQELQKACQKEEIAIHDVMTYMDVALKKLELMRVDPYVGGLEKKHLETNDKPKQTERNVVKALITSFKRDAAAIRD